jgi:predicted acetyltransferase
MDNLDNMNLRLRPYSKADESAARSAHMVAEAEGSHMLLGYEHDTLWDDFLNSIDDQQAGLHHSQYVVRGVQLAADVNGEIVGRASIRFELNAFFETQGGHIGYYVRPEYRRRGYATEILRQALIIARAEGVGPVLMYCSDNNVGSSIAIERNGGVLDETGLSVDDQVTWRRYWIP